MDQDGEQNVALKQALLNSKIIDNLSIEIFNKICQVFDKSSINKRSVKWLKDKIGGICLTQGQEDNFSQYLKLPKFNVLTPQVKNVLKQAFQQIWKNYQICFKKAKQYQKVLKYLPKLQTQQQKIQYHLKNLQTYQNSQQCPLSLKQKSLGYINPQVAQIGYNRQISRALPSFQQFRRQSSNQYANRLDTYSGFPPINQYNYPNYLPYNNLTSSMPITNINKELEYNYRKRMQNQLFEKNKYQNKRSTNLFSGINSQNLQSSEKLSKKQKNKQKIIIKKKQMQKLSNKKEAQNIFPSYQQQNPASQSQIDQQQQDQPIFHDLTSYENSQELQLNEKFSKCVCKGKKVFKKNIQNQRSKYFQCNLCGSCQHYECLKMNTDLKKEQYEANTCMICKCDYMNESWYELHEPLLAEGWLLFSSDQKKKDILLQQQLFNQYLYLLDRQKQRQKQSIQKDEQGKMINQPQAQVEKPEQNPKKYKIIVRMLRTINQKQQKQKQKSAKKYNTLTLTKNDINHLKKLPKPKIDLDFGSSIIKQPFFLFYKVCLIAEKTQEDIIKRCMRIRQEQNRIGGIKRKNWIQKYFINHPQENEIIVNNYEQEIINPFRGNNCQHTKFINLKNQLLLNETIKQKNYVTVPCCQCGQSIDQIELDFDLIQKLKQLKQLKQSGCGQFPQKIIYYRSGEIKLIYVNDNSQQLRAYEGIQRNEESIENQQNVQKNNKPIEG